MYLSIIFLPFLSSAVLAIFPTTLTLEKSFNEAAEVAQQAFSVAEQERLPSMIGQIISIPDRNAASAIPLENEVKQTLSSSDDAVPPSKIWNALQMEKNTWNSMAYIQKRIGSSYFQQTAVNALGANNAMNSIRQLQNDLSVLMSRNTEKTSTAELVMNAARAFSENNLGVDAKSSEHSPKFALVLNDQEFQKLSAPIREKLNNLWDASRYSIPRGTLTIENRISLARSVIEGKAFKRVLTEVLETNDATVNNKLNVLKAQISVDSAKAHLKARKIQFDALDRVRNSLIGFETRIQDPQFKDSVAKIIHASATNDYLKDLQNELNFLKDINSFRISVVEKGMNNANDKLRYAKRHATAIRSVYNMDENSISSLIDKVVWKMRQNINSVHQLSDHDLDAAKTLMALKTDKIQ